MGICSSGTEKEDKKKGRHKSKKDKKGKGEGIGGEIDEASEIEHERGKV